MLHKQPLDGRSDLKLITQSIIGRCHDEPYGNQYLAYLRAEAPNVFLESSTLHWPSFFQDSQPCYPIG
jgi:hypothetical protein